MKHAAATSCAIARECGGCSRIHVPYAQQLEEKQLYIEQLFEEVAAPSACIQPILGMDEPWHYRNKIVSPFAPSKKGPSLKSMMRTGRSGLLAARRSTILTGMYKAGTHELIACEECPVEHPSGRRIIAAVRAIMARYRMEPYDEDAGTGFVRHVVVRVGHASEEVLVTLVTNGREFTGAKNFCRELVKACPEVTTIVQNVNTRQTNAIFGDEERTLYGPGFILDTLCGLSFRISSNSFYQTNAAQTEVLYRTAIDMLGAGSASPDTPISADALIDPHAPISSVPAPNSDAPTSIIDAYCGTGTIGLVAAAAIPGVQVIGVDSVESAIADARQNAVHNGIENARFVAQDAAAFMQGYAALGEHIDAVFMDPPRAGASEEFLEALASLAPERVIYISCNPETQVRDIRTLLASGYTLEVVQPVDMFPHTTHIETVALLSR